MAQFNTTKQLPLPGSLDAEVRLKEEIARLRTSDALWYEHTQDLEKIMYDLRQERDKARADLQSHHLDLLLAQSQVTLLTIQLQSLRHNTAPAGMPPWLAQELRRLLSIAHPDKWHNQPAEALAHEITVVLNTLRARVQEDVPPCA